MDNLEDVPRLFSSFIVRNSQEPIKIEWVGDDILSFQTALHILFILFEPIMFWFIYTTPLTSCVGTNGHSLTSFQIP